MAKRSRQRTPSPEPRQARPAAGGSAGSPPATTRPTTRRTRAVRRQREQGPLERYRGLITIGVAAVGVLIIFFLFFQSSARGAYECDTLLQPGATDPPAPIRPTPAAGSPAATADASPGVASPGPGTSPETGSPAASPAAESPSPAASPGATGSPAASPAAPASPAPGATPRLGFTTTEVGREHVRDPSQTLRYAFCPPTSGPHYNAANLGPIQGEVYPPAQERSPGGWIHNLEHGWVVALYRCPTADDCVTDAEMAELQRFFAQAPDSPVAQNCPGKVLVARFDEMPTRFAVLAWNRAMLMDEFDLDRAITFTEQWIDHEAVPERGVC